MIKRDYYHAEKWGRRVENLATWLLRFKGYKTLERRFKTPVGEIDLIMKRGNTIVFIEVKGRKLLQEAYESLKITQLNRIKQAANLYLSKYPYYLNYTLRFDVVLISPYRFPIHLENAW